MRKETLTFEDYNGKEHTEDFYFYLNEMELTEYQTEWEGGIQAVLRKIQLSQDSKLTVEMMKKLITISYGERVDNRFEKFDKEGNRLVYKNFFSTGADSALFMKMLTGDGHEISDFIHDVLPKKLTEELEKEQKENKPAVVVPGLGAPANK